MAETTAKMVMDWYSDASKALADMQSIIGKQDQMIKGLKESSRAARESAKAMREIKDGANEALGLLGIGGGIAGGIAFISKMTQDWLAFSKDVYQTYLNVNKELIKSIGLSGDLANLSEVRAKLEKLSTPGVGLAEKGQIYRAISGDMPGTSIEQRLQLTQQAAKGKLLYGDAVNFAGQVAAVADLYGGKLPAGDSGDVAAAVQAGLGSNADKLGGIVTKSATKLATSGMDPDQALAIAIAAGKAEQIREFGSIADLLTKTKIFQPETDPLTGKQRSISDTEKTEKEFYGLGANDRWSWLMKNRGDKSAYITQDTGALNAIAGEDIAGIAAGLKTARTQDLLNKQLKTTIGDTAGGSLATEYLLDEQIEQKKLAGSSRFRAIEQARKQFELERQGYLGESGGGVGARTLATGSKALFETMMFFGMKPQMALDVNRLPGQSTFAPNPLSGEEQMKKMVEELKGLRSDLKQQRGNVVFD